MRKYTFIAVLALLIPLVARADRDDQKTEYLVANNPVVKKFSFPNWKRHNRKSKRRRF